MAAKSTKVTAKPVRKRAPARKTAKSKETRVLSAKPDNKTADTKALQTKRRISYALLAVVLLLGLFAYLNKGLFVAATVDGKPVTRLELIKELESQSGRETLENLVNKKLIEVHAQKANVKVTEEDINTEVEALRSMLEAQGTNLEQALEMQGQDISILRENVRLKLTVERMLSDKINVTEEETRQYYETNKDFYEGLAFTDVSGEIENQLAEQKLSSEFQVWLSEARANTQIKYFLNN
jgi:hypothetical protein